MRLRLNEFEGWVLDHCDFNNLPTLGYIFFITTDIYICHPRHTTKRDRNTLSRLINFLSFGGDEAQAILSMLMAARPAEKQVYYINGFNNK
ncbi:hypothetical protein IHE33_07090 [Mycetohabitans endofungorum]|uniref:hypothetical protein n=1 Tax=Mycetohabitans endofungorum TaxID=417203 RepID=UPI0030CD8E99